MALAKTMASSAMVAMSLPSRTLGAETPMNTSAAPTPETTTLTSFNALNRAALPSMAGRAAAGPMSPRPSTGVSSVTTATVLRLRVSRRTSLGLSRTGMHTRATPVV